MLKKYHKIIKKSFNRKRKNHVFYEKHHIIPKSIFHSDYAHETLNEYNIKNINKENLTYLTPKEHLYCHLILVEIFRNKNKNCYIKMLYAANMMNSRVKGNFLLYNKIRKEYSEYLSQSMKGKPSKAKGKKWTEEQRKNKSKNHPMRGKTYGEYFGKDIAEKIKKMRKFKRKPMSLETRKKLSNRVISDSWKEKISKAHKGKKITEETKAKIIKVTSNTLLNKHVDQKVYLFENIKTKENFIGRLIDIKKIYNISQGKKLKMGEIVKNWKINFPVFKPRNMQKIALQNEIIFKDFQRMFYDFQ